MECCCRLPQTTVVNNWVDMTVGRLQQCYSSAAQNINVTTSTTRTVGYYGHYVVLLQTPVAAQDTSRPPSHAPAAILAGARRVSTRVPHPSQCAVEAAEAASSGSTGTHPGTKCKAQSNPNPDCRVTHKVVINLVDDVADPDDDGATTEPTTELADDDGATTKPATELADDDYESIRAMADADNQVVSVRSWEMIPQATARAICRAWPIRARAIVRVIMIRYEASAMTKHDGKRNA
ncbi:hypothetical protein EDB89DRAFT_1909080 [Lactarius sanguifluus]|nr:hypothetical protein EDB89DRAFT_1909080 [Lactarius sanguifluus]